MKNINLELGIGLFLLVLLPSMGLAGDTPTPVPNQAVLTLKAHDGTIEFFENGKKVATEKYGKEAGQLIESTGKVPDGEYKNFEDGKLSEEAFYKDGKMNGLEEDYYKTGQLEAEGNRLDGKMEGVCKLYNIDGSLSNETTFKDGIADGLFKSYDKDGKVIAISIWKDGNIILQPSPPDSPGGKWYSYDPQGKKHIYSSEKNAELGIDMESEADSNFPNIAKNYRSLKKKPSLPEDARKYAVQAKGAMDDKRFSDAVDLYQKALEIAPWWPQGHYNRALLLGEANNYSEAVSEMQKYLLLVPHAKDARQAQDQIYEWQGKAGQ